MDGVSAGTHIGRYDIVECIHKSELIGLYKAYDTKLERFVYLKLVLHGVDYSNASVLSFLDEAKVLAKLSHPNIVKVLDFGHEDDNLFIINEYTEGKTLAELITTPMHWRRALKILLPVAEALAYAHSKGIIHRDLRPENIIVADEDQPLLSDFSLMRIIEDEETKDMTGTNVGLGSPAYISPEQGKGLPVDFRSDIYSLGVVLFEVITGKKPFIADSSMEIVIQHVMKKPPKPSSLIPDLPGSVEEIILTALLKDADKRYQTMEQLADAIRAVLSTDTGLVHKKIKITTGMVVLFVLIGIGLISGGAWLWKGRNASPVPTITASASLFEEDDPPTGSGSEEPISTQPEEGSASAPASTPTPDLMAALPTYPVLPGTQVPSSSDITRDNVTSMVEFARLGMPEINQLLFIQNDQTLVGATSAGLYFFDADSLEPMYLLDTGGWVTAIAVSDDQEWIVTGDMQGTVSVWNAYTGEKNTSFRGGSGEITAVDISSDNARIAFASYMVIKIWDNEQNELLFETRKNALRINKLYFLQNQDLFVTGGDDFQINVWNASTGEVVRKITAAQQINDLTLSSNGDTVAVALQNSSVQVWDINDGKLINTINASTNVTPYTAIHYLPSNLIFLAGAEDGIIRMWNIYAANCLWETPPVNQSQAEPIKMMAVSRNGTRAVTLTDDGTITLWDITKQEKIASHDYHYGAINRAEISPDGQMLVYQVDDDFVVTYSLQKKQTMSKTNGIIPRGSPISEDSTKLLIETNDLNLYALSSNGAEFAYTFYDTPVNGLVNYILDDTIAAVSSGRAIQIWATASGRELVPNLVKTNGNCSVLYRINGEFLAAGSTIGVLGMDDNLEYFCRVTRNPQETSIDFLPDGSVVAFSVDNQVLEIWNMLLDHKQTITSAAPGNMLDISISNDASLLAGASASGVIEIYDLDTMELLHSIDTGDSQVNQVTFSRDQKYIISGSDDGTVRIWGVVP